MIAVAIVTESVLDRGAFMPSAREITGENHVTDVDRKPGLSRLYDDLEILNHFADIGTNLTTAITYIGFLVAGFDEDIDEFIAFARGMPHLPTTRIDQRGVRAVVITGNLDQWKASTIEGCRNLVVRQAYNEVYRQLIQRGLIWLFEDYRTVNEHNGQFLLEKK